MKTAREAMRVEGWRVMFAGLGPTLIRAIPVCVLGDLEGEKAADVIGQYGDFLDF